MSLICHVTSWMSSSLSNPGKVLLTAEITIKFFIQNWNENSISQPNPGRGLLPRIQYAAEITILEQTYELSISVSFGP